jgi:hypothetical protein
MLKRSAFRAWVCYLVIECFTVAAFFRPAAFGFCRHPQATGWMPAVALLPGLIPAMLSTPSLSGANCSSWTHAQTLFAMIAVGTNCALLWFWFRWRDFKRGFVD